MKDLFDITADDLKEFDVVIDAFGRWTGENIALAYYFPSAPLRSFEQFEDSIVGRRRSGSLYIDPAHTVQVMDLDNFPEAFKPVAFYTGEALKMLRERNDVVWTYLSPAADFQADGARTGNILLGGEEYFVNEKGVSAISYADYAIAMIDEIEKADHIQKRFSVIGA